MKKAKSGRHFFTILFFVLAMLGISVQAKTTNAKSYSLKNVTKASVVQGKWVTKSGDIRFKNDDGKYVKNRWIGFEDHIYYLNSKGVRTTGWIQYRKKMYYTDKNGALVTGWLKNRYYLKKDGSRATGITEIQGKTYYFDAKSGKKKTGWIKDGKALYYFETETGVMRTKSWVKKGKQYYYVGSNGKVKKSCWLTIGNQKYYLDNTGARVTGEYWVKDKAYYFKSNGVYDPTVKVKSTINPNKPMIALTFDDGPGPYTNRLLNCLEKNQAKATFFMVGSSVSSYKKVVKRMASMGCELGNHSYSHPAFTTLSVAGMKSQVNNTNKKIKEASGQYPTVFRLPYGDGWNNGTVLNTLGLPSIYWSLDTRDWANTGSSSHTVNEVLNYVKSGDIVLMHDIHSATVQACEKIIPALKKRGYQMVTVSQLAKYKGKKNLRAGKTYMNFR